MTNNAFREMLRLLHQHQEAQVEINRKLIEVLPPEVKARIPDDWPTFIEYGLDFVYADAIRFCRDLIEAEKEKEKRHGTAR